MENEKIKTEPEIKTELTKEDFIKSKKETTEEYYCPKCNAILKARQEQCGNCKNKISWSEESE